MKILNWSAKLSILVLSRNFQLMKGLKGWFFVFADQILFSATEGEAVILQPSQDAVELSCIEIVWFKYIDKDTSVDIARSNTNEVLYFGEYCSDSSSQCKRSRKADLKRDNRKIDYPRAANN